MACSRRTLVLPFAFNWLPVPSLKMTRFLPIDPPSGRPSANLSPNGGGGWVSPRSGTGVVGEDLEQVAAGVLEVHRVGGAVHPARAARSLHVVRPRWAIAVDGPPGADPLEGGFEFHPAHGERQMPGNRLFSLNEIERQIGGDQHHLEGTVAPLVLETQDVAIEGDRSSVIGDFQDGVIELQSHAVDPTGNLDRGYFLRDEPALASGHFRPHPDHSLIGGPNPPGATVAIG